jgi:hypothetical protein
MKVFFSDFAVGAYQSDALFVVRSRPVIDMKATLTISPSPIPLSSEGTIRTRWYHLSSGQCYGTDML